jgi:succinoglycan biosynthesis transport protein ExoP
MDLIYFFKVLLRKKWIIGSLSFLAVVAAFFFLRNKKEVFKSQAQYSTGFTAEKVRMVDGSSGIDIYTADMKFNNVIETFKSPKVINAIAYKLLFHDLVNPATAYIKLSEKNKASALYKSVNRDTAIAILREAIIQNKLLFSNTEKEKSLIEYFKLYGYDYDNIRSHLLIERVGRTDYLNITFWSENPNLSALVVNAMGDEFLNYYKNLISQRSKENADEIKTMVTSQQNNIDSLGKLLYNEKVKQGSIDPVSLSTSAMETVKELESRLAEEKSKQNEHLNRKTYLVEWLKILQTRLTSTGGSVSNDEVIALVNKKNNLVAELAKKGGTDLELEKQISDLRAEIDIKSSLVSSRKDNGTKNKEIDDIKNKINEEDALLTAANSTIEDYTARIRKYTNMANSAPVGSDVTINALKSKLDIENAMMSTVTEKYYKAEGLVKDDPTTNFIQTAVGQPALGPESKKTMMTMLLSGMSMFFLSSVIFLLLEVFDPRAKTPTLFSKQVKLHLAGILNDIPIKKATEQEILMTDYLGKKYARQIFYKNNIRKLRYQLLNSPNKICLITSTQKQVGKTSVIESLAASLLLSKKRVMILDLNFGNNTITQKHYPPVLIQDIGEIVKYDIPLKNQQLLRDTESIDGLHIIGCREGNYTPSEALHNIDLERFLKLLKDEFDFILIEGAALNDFADSRELAVYAEEVFTVFSATLPVSQEDNKSIQFINSLGEKNKGAILNNVRLENINF